MADVTWLQARGRALQAEAGKPSKSSENIVTTKKRYSFSGTMKAQL